MLAFARMDPFDGTTPRVDNRPKRCVFALVAVVAHPIHIPIGGYGKKRHHQEKDYESFHQNPPGIPGISGMLGMLMPPPDSEDDPPLELLLPEPPELDV